MKLANISSVFRSTLAADAFDGWIKKETRVLDVGCGTGVVAKELQKRFDLEIVGCDIENYLITDIPFKKIKNETKLPFKNKSFDYALFIDMLHHTSYATQKKLIHEGLRVAKTLLIFELKGDSTGKMLDCLLNKIHHPRMEVPFTYRTKSDWLKLGKENQIKVKTRSVRKPFFYPFKHMAFKFEK